MWIAPCERRFWLVHDGGNVDVCLKHPGFDVDVAVSTTVRVLAEVWRGLRPLGDELRAGRLRIAEAPRHCRALPRWLLLSAYASITRERSP